MGVRFRLHPAIAAASLLLAFALASSAQAAEFNRVDRPTCSITLTGPIEPGDQTKLETLLAERNSERLCLNSPGGNYAEALKMIEFILDGWTDLTTVVEANAECLSACALIFLSGYDYLGERARTPSRFLHVAGRLGLHAPYIDAATPPQTQAVAEMVYRGGVRAIGRLLEIASQSADEKLFPTALLAEALKMGPGEFFWIDNVDRLGRWDIGVLGMAAPKTVTEDMLHTACSNFDVWQRSASYIDLIGDEPRPPKGKPVALKGRLHQTLLPGFGGEGTYLCAVNVYRAPNSKLYLDLALVAEASDALKPEALEESITQRTKDSRNPDLEVLSFHPNYYFLPAATKLQELGRAE